MATAQKASAKWLKWCVAVALLLPLCAVWTLAAWRLGRVMLMGGETTRNPLLLSFAGGALAWWICFTAGIKPVRLYVLGHELTHAIWAWLFWGRVTALKVGLEGGYVRTDRVNFWISLAPYFFPLYSVLAVWLWWLAGFWVNLGGQLWVLLAVLGLTWGFHISFTVMMLGRVQPDISGEGWLFSLSLIYLMNLIPLVLLLVFVSPELRAHDLGRALVWAAGWLRHAAIQGAALARDVLR
ncbi:MAG TPA: hypothetical protein PLU30_01845 [Verrucomicrobiae bacterium]|nr:hypothetical protein [Verrucomicrobiae bacterium]